ncbi:hypothetical protein B5U98_16075 [Bosea sp. Tri-39]|nr:hypothetical protein BLM15_05430 [Bosea sp. Tri-49]RXT21959.1 hypothetical protein B5U98_16075 [Bosea sp. Tri-39]RXT32299.1 hypothetical protein B5U99_26920 [Bosea sp. Tri-54]
MGQIHWRGGLGNPPGCGCESAAAGRGTARKPAEAGMLQGEEFDQETTTGASGRAGEKPVAT